MSDLAYAGQVRDALRGENDGLTITEIVERTQLTERLARIGVGILDGLGEVKEARRHTPGKRGAMPLTYTLKTLQ